MFKCVLAVNKGQAECDSKKASGLPTQHRLDTCPQILKFTHFLKLLACFYTVYYKKSPRPMRMTHDNSLGIISCVEIPDQTLALHFMQRNNLEQMM